MAVEPNPTGGSPVSREPSDGPRRRLLALRPLLLAAGLISLIVGSFLLLEGVPSAGHSAGTATEATDSGLGTSTAAMLDFTSPDVIVGPELGTGAATQRLLGSSPSDPLDRSLLLTAGEGEAAQSKATPTTAPPVAAAAPTGAVPPGEPASLPAPAPPTPVPQPPLAPTEAPLLPAPTPIPPAPAPPLPTPVQPTPTPPPPEPTPAPPPPTPASPPPMSVTPAAVAGVSLSPLEADLTNRLNAQRAAAGLPPLAVDADLVAIARMRSQDMATRAYFSHTSPEGQTAFSLLDQRGIAYAWAGENLARNNYPAGETVGVAISDLMASPAHRDNILSGNYTRVGVGHAEDGSGMHYFTMIFVG